VLKRIAAITSVLFTAAALTAASATGANAVAKPLIPAATEAPLSGAATYCAESVAFENSYGGGNGQYFYNRTASPHQLLANAAKSGYCGTELSDGFYLMVDAATGECLRVDTANRGVDEASCNGGDADEQINILTTANPGWYEFQFYEVNRACIYQDGRDSPVTYNPCTSSTGDIWIAEG
jgi:hypothetical protein